LTGIACPLKWRLEVVSYSQLQAHIRFVHYLLDFDFHLRAGIADCFIRFEAGILRRRRRRRRVVYCGNGGGGSSSSSSDRVLS